MNGSIFNLRRSARPARAAGILARLIPIVACLLVPSAGRVTAQVPLDPTNATQSRPATTRVTLPRSGEDLDKTIIAVEGRLGDARLKVAAAKAAGAAHATPEEFNEAEQVSQQWIISLDQHGRHLRHLKDVRRVNQESAAQQESWRKRVQPATILAAEQLTDAIAACRLELRTAQMLLSILEGEIARYSTRVNESHKRLRLARDTANTIAAASSRQDWLIQLAELCNHADEAAVEAAEIGRLVTWESLDGQQRQAEFLETTLKGLRSRSRISSGDLTGILAQIQDKRAALRNEMSAAFALDRELRAARDAAVEQWQAAQPQSAGIRSLEAAVEVAKARVETSGRRVASFHGFLQLADHAQAVWEDRFWITEPRAISVLRTKQKHYRHLLDQLRQWRSLMEQSVSAVSDQALRQALKAGDTRLSESERDFARQIHTTLQERAWVELRAVGALVFTEELTMRLNDELSEQITRTSMGNRLQSVMETAGSVIAALWRTELYIAEDSVIANGQKVAIPRSITLGKVLIALTIFAVGLLLARWAYRLGNRVLRFERSGHPSAELASQALAAVCALIALFVAMASVRIPWTVFAFMGGALAIGVGFGAQTLINNFISGVILLCERSIRVGDIVEVDDQRGKIVRVGLRNSLVARGDGIEVLVPNSQFLEKKVVNWTLSDDVVRSEVSVSVAYGADADQVTALIAQAASEHGLVLKQPAPEVLLDNFGESAMAFTLEFWLHMANRVGGGRVRSDLRHRIKELFDEAGIVLAHSQRDVHLDASRPLEIKVVNELQGRAGPLGRPRCEETSNGIGG